MKGDAQRVGAQHELSHPCCWDCTRLQVQARTRDKSPSDSCTHTKTDGCRLKPISWQAFECQVGRRMYHTHKHTHQPPWQPWPPSWTPWLCVPCRLWRPPRQPHPQPCASCAPVHNLFNTSGGVIISMPWGPAHAEAVAQWNLEFLVPIQATPAKSSAHTHASWTQHPCTRSRYYCRYCHIQAPTQKHTITRIHTLRYLPRRSSRTITPATCLHRFSSTPGAGMDAPTIGASSGRSARTWVSASCGLNRFTAQRKGSICSRSCCFLNRSASA